MSVPPARPELRELAGEALQAVEHGHDAVVGRVVSFQGIGGRRAGEAVLARPDGSLSGHLLGGAAPIPPGALVGPVRLLELPVGDEEAVAAGLACGGVATVLVTDADVVPAAAWRALSEGMAVAMATTLEGESGGVVAVVADRATGSLVRYGGLADEAADELAERAARDALRGGRELSEVRTTGSTSLVIEVYLPTTTLFVIGEGGLAEALVAQGALLGWRVETDPSYGERARALVSRLGPSDALVVLSHDHDLATPALADALGLRCYVGALGSRHTQAARRERLARAGLAAEDLDRLHGPAGLDLGSRTPEETAVAIVAEVLAARSGRTGASLRTASGPINGWGSPGDDLASLYMVNAIVLIKADPERVASLGRALADVDGVDVAYSVAGDEDLVAMVRAVDHERLAELVTGKIATLKGITRTRTLIAFRAYSSEDLANI